MMPMNMSMNTQGNAFANQSDTNQHQYGTTNNWTPQQQQTAQQFGNWINTQIGQGSQGYNGQMVAGLSQPQQSSLNWLNSYMNQGTPQQYDWANTALKNTIQGNYANNQADPTQQGSFYQWAQQQANGPLQDAQSSNIYDTKATDALYKQIQDQTLRDLPQLQNTLANNANLSGMYFSGGHNQVQSDLLKNTQGQLLDTLANLKYSDQTAANQLAATREARNYDTLSNLLNSGYQSGTGLVNTREQNAVNAIPTAMDVGNQYSNQDLNKVAAGQTYGALPQTNQQQQLDAQYQEFLRTLPENSPLLQYMMQYLGQQGMQNYSNAGDSTTTNYGLSGTLGTSFGMGMGGQ